MRAIIKILPKATVLDPQGEAVQKAIHQLGIENVQKVRVGKWIEVKIADSSKERVREKLDMICQEFLSHPLIEDYELELVSESKSANTPKIHDRTTKTNNQNECQNS